MIINMCIKNYLVSSHCFKMSMLIDSDVEYLKRTLLGNVYFYGYIEDDVQQVFYNFWLVRLYCKLLLCKNQIK